jgi:hypothetical protein
MDKLFTIEEAEALLPELDRMVREMMALRAECELIEREGRERVDRITTSGGSFVDHTPFLEARNGLASSAARLQSLMSVIEGHGVLLKDLERGLLDFPALYHGERVLLCWMLGEPKIDHWHRVEDGFRGRRPVGNDFRKRPG